MATLIKKLDEVRPNLWEKFDWQSQGFIAPMESIIYENAIKRLVVILGRGSYFLLQDISHVLRVLTGGKVNPLIGAAGISAFPVSARVVQKEGFKYNRKSYLSCMPWGIMPAARWAR